MNKNTLTMLALMMGATSLCQAAGNAPAAPEQKPVATAPKYEFCKALQDRFKFFDAKRDHAENPWIQEVSLKFRAQWQYGYLDPVGDHVKGEADGHGRRTNNEWRRFRIGGQAKVLNHFTLFANFNIGGLDGRYKYANGDWSQSDTEASVDEIFISGDFKPVSFTLGKHKPAFMGEYRTSSAKILTIERSLIVNQLKAEKLYGLSFRNSDKKAKLGWELGVWVNGVDEDNIWYLPRFGSDDKYMLGGGLSYATGKHGRLYLDYMHSFADADRLGDTGYSYQGCGARDVVSLTFEGKQDRLSFMAEAIAGFNVLNGQEGAENVWGLVLMSSYRLSPHWEGVFRYQLAAGSNAVAGDSRYYTTNSDYASVSDLTQGFYFGANYYVCPDNPHMMKWMLGAEYLNSHGTDAKDKKGFTGWCFTTALRANF